MLKKCIALVSCMTLLSLGLSGCSKKEEAVREVASTGTNVSVYEVVEGSLESTVSYSGTISAADSVSVTAKVSAKANAVYAEEGDYVQMGQVLCELDSTDIRLSYEQALAGYNSAVASYNSIVNSSSKQSSAQAKQALTSAQIAYNQAKTNYEREKGLSSSASQVQQAKQQYETARLNYEREKTIYETNSSLIAAQSGVTSADNSVQTAQANYDRIKQLFDMGGATQVELDNAQIALDNAKASADSAHASLETTQATSTAAMDAAYSQMVSAQKNLEIVQSTATVALDNAEAALENAENALRTAEENIGLTDSANAAAVETAMASVESARASVNIAKNSLNNTSITAPISGYISKSTAARSQNVAAGAEIFVIKNTDIVDAEINVTESVIPLIQEGTKAVVSVASAQLFDIEGSVTSINPVKDEATGLYSVKVTMNNSSGKLNIGMLADISLTTAELDGITKIPSEALINEDEEYFVYIAKDNIAEKVRVEPGITDEIYTEIISGINIGDKVIVSGKEYISETNNEINISEEYNPE